MVGTYCSTPDAHPGPVNFLTCVDADCSAVGRVSAVPSTWTTGIPHTFGTPPAENEGVLVGNSTLVCWLEQLIPDSAVPGLRRYVYNDAVGWCEVLRTAAEYHAGTGSKAGHFKGVGMRP